MTTQGSTADPSGSIPRDPEIALRLLDWYDGSARDLPWRRTSDPYAVWISEIMLQQTRVETVRPYYTRFLERFPTVSSLASAKEDEVLSLWSGLGYYSRARNLHRGAGIVAERHGGEFPRDRKVALEIPGIGPYTSAAILSIAYGSRYAVVDGNVARVLARLGRIGPPDDRRHPRLEAIAMTLLSPDRPGDHNQAMMELGATVCTPRAPSCDRCPLAFACRAHQDGVVEDYPSRKERNRTVPVEVLLFLVQHPSRGLLLERGSWPLLPGLWLPPIVEFAGPEESRDGAFNRWTSRRQPGLRAGRWIDHGTIRHAITHRRIRLHVVSGTLFDPCEPRDDLICALPSEWTNLGRSSLLTKALRRAEPKRDATQPGMSWG